MNPSPDTVFPIIGLNSVVSKDVEPYAIVAGNPARFIRKRFDNELIDFSFVN